MAQERNTRTEGAGGEGTRPGARGDAQSAGESVRQTVSDTATDAQQRIAEQYEAIRSRVNNLDWRREVRERPLVFALGAAAAGLLIGYAVRGASPGGTDETSERQGVYSESLFGRRARGSRYKGSGYRASEEGYGSMAGASAGLGLVSAAMNSPALERVRGELANLGSRTLDELSRIAKETALPAVNDMAKDWLGQRRRRT
jgi:hypothetical protein